MKNSFLNVRPVVVSALCALLAAGVTPSYAVTSQTPPNRFAELSDEFMKQSLVLSPSTASQVGFHKYVDVKADKVIELDAVLDDLSLSGLDKQRKFYADWRERFHKETPISSLNPEDAADWQLIDDQIGAELLDFDEIQSHLHNPSVTVELIGSAIFQPLTENYAPKDVRLKHILSRIEQIPQLLMQVQIYLDNADPIYISNAIDENDGNIDLIENTIAAEIPPGSPLKAEYDRVAPISIAALKKFSKWMQDDLAKRPCTRSWKLGKDLYDKKFKLIMEVAVTPEQVLQDAEAELKSVRTEMLQLAIPMHKTMYPDHSDHSDVTGTARENLIIGEVLRKISDDHPQRDQLIPTIESELENIKHFIREKKIVSMGARDNLKVVPTPLFERGVLSVAAFHAAPALDPKAEAEYWVTPIDAKTSDSKAESKLREYNNFTLRWLTIHEALPGHYVQFEHVNDIQPERRRLIRSLYGNGAYIEGWAEYIAQVMMDEGYMKNDPRFRMTMRKIRLRVLANAILDIGMHTMDMTDQQAIDLMTVSAFQTQAEAQGKLKRAKLTSTQLPTYYVGVHEWLEFRKAYQAKAGDQFNLLKFHDQALDEGPLPVPVVEKLMMSQSPAP